MDDESIQQFLQLTGVEDPKLAAFFLESAGGDVSLAVNMYLDGRSTSKKPSKKPSKKKKSRFDDSESGDSEEQQRPTKKQVGTSTFRLASPLLVSIEAAPFLHKLLSTSIFFLLFNGLTIRVCDFSEKKLELRVASLAQIPRARTRQTMSISTTMCERPSNPSKCASSIPLLRITTSNADAFVLFQTQYF